MEEERDAAYALFYTGGQEVVLPSEARDVKQFMVMRKLIPYTRRTTYATFAQV